MSFWRTSRMCCLSWVSWYMEEGPSSVLPWRWCGWSATRSHHLGGCCFMPWLTMGRGRNWPSDLAPASQLWASPAAASPFPLGRLAAAVWASPAAASPFPQCGFVLCPGCSFPWARWGFQLRTCEVLKWWPGKRWLSLPLRIPRGTGTISPMVSEGPSAAMPSFTPCFLHVLASGFW